MNNNDMVDINKQSLDSANSTANKLYVTDYDEAKIVTHWGEIPRKIEDPFIPDVTEDIEKSMSKFCLAEFDTEYDSDQIHKSEQIVIHSMDPLVLYAISLHKYANDLTDMIRVAELAIESHLIPPEDAVPPIPEIPHVPRRHVKNSLNYISKDFTPFAVGNEIELPELSDSVVKQILIKCVATITAHMGYETTHQSVLDFLTDVLETFLIKIARTLKSVQEEDDRGFPEVAERVLIEMGMGGVRGLHDFYQHRVIKYINVLRSRCKDLNDRYAKLLVPKSNSPSDKLNKKSFRENAVEENGTEGDNTEVHFSATEGDVGLSLETGFQLLNSLEAVTNLQNLAEGEEENVNASPGVLSIPETETTSNLSPFTKKKRAK